MKYYYKNQLTNLQYAVVGYNTSIYGTELGDTGGGHSPIIGWAYDGNPIYGPYGFSDPKDSNSSIKLLNTSYTLDTSNIINRPSSFSSGFFVEDYKFTDDGDLDLVMEDLPKHLIIQMVFMLILLV